MDNFEQYLQSSIPDFPPKGLFDPIAYTLEVAGKRLRPRLALMAYEMFDGQSVKEEAYPVAAALEIFHNFTLLHDDLMDSSDKRRKRPTVWKKWNANAAILSGDAMLVLAYEVLEKSESHAFKKILKAFNQLAMEVCMGQQYDMDFELRNNVSIEEYMEMIKLKTSVLIGGALQMGALAAGADERAANQIYNVGLKMGLTFQLQDDFLDTFGDEAVFGKPTGGDIREKKKTWLMIRAMEEAEIRHEKEFFMNLCSLEDLPKRVQEVKEKYLAYGVDKDATNFIDALTREALDELDKLSIKQDKIKLKDELKQLIQSLAKRNH